ncbi:flagellar basal-body MS-ring/collar protein FliF [Aquabacterium sp. A7-Y]|uniref:flagellar basal-body MS-ring/collar protein FliF n=1 Tax=Aquabacterium sp. A7-Y TaxID=1349605 RepID=UPI00223E5736|nr:flagellar basal-body MS-ring/collar protein FliF [Aquabacterium sp. A7-Y]MCW7536518.1 flagellar basal-body MS-ring/collar protein FliF [Aquabacterium sp. A7-Y]
MLNSVKTGLQRLGPQVVRGGLPAALLSRLLPLVLLAIGVTALVMMLVWRDQSAYKPVFGSREKVAVADMMAVLDAEQVSYRVHPETGQVLVPEEQLGRVRMLLAGKGVVAKLPAGLELMDRNDPLGVSQFVQDVRFRRGLEGELALSIMSLDAVETARVHLAMAKSSSFVVSDGAPSSASVVLTLKPGRSLAAEQIAAVVKLVSGSVAGLDAQRVSLVDQAGNLLSSRIDLSDGFDGSAQGDEAARRAKEETLRNVAALLGPMLGEANYKASVTAVVDNDRVEETLERFGEAPKVTNEAMREEQDVDPMALGVPGSLSNRPVPAGPAASGAEPGTARKNATTRQYAYDRSVTRIKRSRGKLSKLSVAVVLNNAAAPGGKGQWSAAEVAGIERLLRTGLGMDTERGDQIAVSAVAFPSAAALPQVAWWEQHDRWLDIGSWLLTPLAFLFGYLLIARPLLRSLQQRLTPRAAAMASGASAAALGGETLASHPGVIPLGGPAAAGPAAVATAAMAAPGMPVVPLLENYDLPPAGSPVDVMVDHLKTLAAKEPERVAEVVKQWMQKHG